MSRGCAVTVYLSGSEARDNRTHWSKWFNRDMVVNFPDRVANHNGGDWDVNEDYVQYWNISGARKSSHSIKAYNPWIGQPYIEIDDNRYHLDEGQEESKLTPLPGRQDLFYVYTVKRLNDSNDFKEYEVHIYR